MSNWIFHLLFVLLLSAGVKATEFIEIAGEVKLPLLVGWSLTGNSLSFPACIVNEQYGAEMLVFKSDVSDKETINSPEELKQTVDGIIENVILGMPNSRLLTSTGYHRDDRIRFVMEFSSEESPTTSTTYNRLMGIVYRHPDGRQLLFTLWGKCDLDVSSLVERDFQIMQEEFIYNGPAAADVFAVPVKRKSWYMAVVATAIVASLFVLRRRVRIRRFRIVGNHKDWQCQCGRFNSGGYSVCPRCGETRKSQAFT